MAEHWGQPSAVYVFVRTDLPVPGQLVQAAHACLAAGRRFAPPADCHVVMLSVSSVAELLAAAKQAEYAGIRCVVFEDPDKTPAVTALCTAPVSGAARRHFRHFALWGAPAERR